MAVNQVRIRQLGANPVSSGSSLDTQAGAFGETLVNEFHGRRYEMARNGLLFHCANQAAVVTTVGLAITYTGICLSNPLGSGKNLELTEVGYVFPVAAPAVIVVGLMVGFNGSTNVSHTTPLAPKSSLVGNAAGVGLVDTAATLPTAPWLAKVLGKVDSGAVSVDTQVTMASLQMEGCLLIPPGGYVAMYTSTVSASAGFLGHFEWAEPVITT
jgi:hypothetical protein